MKSYSEYIKSLSKPALEKLILGDDEKPPLLTRNEPKFTRPRLIWAINKLTKDKNLINEYKDYVWGNSNLEKTEKYVDELMNKIEGYKWDAFYNYDYVRFDLKKPSVYWILFISTSAVCLWFWIIIKLIISVWEWI